jgi:hypothetical protein
VQGNAGAIAGGRLLRWRGGSGVRARAREGQRDDGRFP